MVHDDKKSPFAMTFKERDPQYYDATPERRRVERAFREFEEALASRPGSSATATPFQAMRALHDTMTVGEVLLDFAGFLFADWILTPGHSRAQRSWALTLLVRASLDYGREAGPAREGQVSQMSRVVGAMVPLVPVSAMRIFVQWAGDMARGLAGVFEAQPVAVIRGVLFSPYVVKSFDAERALEFWTRAIEETDFPWNIFSAPCRAGRGSVLTEFHIATVVMILGIAPEPAVRRIVAQMIEHARIKRVEVQIQDPLGGTKLGDEVAPVPESERQQLFHNVVSAVTDVHHRGRRSLVADLFGAAGV